MRVTDSNLKEGLRPYGMLWDRWVYGLAIFILNFSFGV